MLHCIAESCLLKKAGARWSNCSIPSSDPNARGSFSYSLQAMSGSDSSGVPSDNLPIPIGVSLIFPCSPIFPPSRRRAEPPSMHGLISWSTSSCLCEAFPVLGVSCGYLSDLTNILIHFPSHCTRIRAFPAVPPQVLTLRDLTLPHGLYLPRPSSARLAQRFRQLSLYQSHHGLGYTTTIPGRATGIWSTRIL